MSYKTEVFGMPRAIQSFTPSACKIISCGLFLHQSTNWEQYEDKGIPWTLRCIRPKLDKSISKSSKTLSISPVWIMSVEYGGHIWADNLILEYSSPPSSSVHKCNKSKIHC